MKRFTLLFAGLILVTYFSTAQIFQKVGTPFKQVHKVKFLQDNLMVILGDSLYIDIWNSSPFIPYFGSGFYTSSDFGKNYQGPYLRGYTCFDVTKSAESDYYAVTMQLNRSSILRSQGSYSNWDLSPLIEDTKLMQKLIIGSYKGKERYFVTSINTSEGLTISDDSFATTNLSNLLSTINDLKISQKTGDIFIASDNSNYGRVARSTDGGNTWTKDVSGLEGLRILCVQPSTTNPAFVYCGADTVTFNKVAIGKGIYFSNDTGKTWTLLSAKGFRVFDIKEHPTESNFIASACGELGVGISSIAGQWFDVVSDGLPQNFDVRNVAIPNLPSNKSGIQVYAALLDGGLYQSNNITSNVPTNSSNLDVSAKIFPNPVRSNHFSLLFNSKSNETLKIEIINTLGQSLLVENISNLNIGDNVISFESLNLPTGNYIMLLQQANNLQNINFEILK
jgi:hypothetical protein